MESSITEYEVYSTTTEAFADETTSDSTTHIHRSFQITDTWDGPIIQNTPVIPAGIQIIMPETAITDNQQTETMKSLIKQQEKKLEPRQ